MPRRPLRLAAAVFLLVAPTLAFSAAPTAAFSLEAPASDGAPLGSAELFVATLAIGMAIRVKDIGSIARKFVTRAQAAGGDYTEGVKAAGQDWETNTAASADNYSAGTQQAIADGRFAKGVREAGAAKFVTKASTLGAQRFGPGVAASEQEFVRGAGPAIELIRGLTLPPRRPKGDPGNQERANHVARALRAWKVGR